MMCTKKNVLIAGNTETGLLKLIAIICMLIDHTGAIFFPSALYLRIVGRIAFPLYAWCLVVGSEYTKNHVFYILRMLLLTAISQPFFVLAFRHDWLHFNIFLTLTMGLIGIYGIKKKQYWLTILAIFSTCFISMDYGFLGVLFICLLYLAKSNKQGLIAFVIAFCLLWGKGTLNFEYFIQYPAHSIQEFINLFIRIFGIQFFAVLSLPFMVMYTKFGYKMSKYFAYSFYPAHLIILYIIRLLVQR